MKLGIAALVCAASVSACTAVRVSGFVRDAATGDPVPNCGLSIAGSYSHVDSAGHYVVKAKMTENPQIEFIANGYESQVIKIDPMGTRYPRVDVALQRNKNAGPCRCECPDHKAAVK